MPKIDNPCHVCHARGVLWLGGNDYVDCPECEGTGRITGWMEIIAPMPKHFIFRSDKPKPTGVVLSEQHRPTSGPVVIAGG